MVFWGNFGTHKQPKKKPKVEFHPLDVVATVVCSGMQTHMLSAPF